MQQKQKTNQVVVEQENEANLMYDLAEGHNITLKGSMNATKDLPAGYEKMLLSLMQDSDSSAAKGVQ